MIKSKWDANFYSYEHTHTHSPQILSAHATRWWACDWTLFVGGLSFSYVKCLNGRNMEMKSTIMKRNRIFDCYIQSPQLLKCTAIAIKAKKIRKYCCVFTYDAEKNYPLPVELKRKVFSYVRSVVCLFVCLLIWQNNSDPTHIRRNIESKPRKENKKKCNIFSAHLKMDDIFAKEIDCHVCVCVDK